MTKGAGHDGSRKKDKTMTAGHGDPVRKDCETVEGMANSMKMLFPQVVNPQPRPPRRKVEDNLQTPGKPFLPYVELHESFRAASEKSFLFGAFVRSWDKIMAGEV